MRGGLFALFDREPEPRTVAVRQMRDDGIWTPVIVYEEDDGSITVSVVPEITIKVIRRDTP